jgi:hypothetical protein
MEKPEAQSRSASRGVTARAAALIAETVEAEGVLLVHDRRLASATALVAGEPIAGSWWSHPLANVIYDALESLEGRFVTCKLVARKLTLIAPRLWPDLAAIGRARQDWQLAGLSAGELALLDRVGTSAGQIRLDQRDLRAAGRRLEERLLVYADQVHTSAGHHVKVLGSWTGWLALRGIEHLPEPAVSTERFEEITRRLSPTRHLLPWPAGSGRA